MIAIIEDDSSIRGLVSYTLSNSGFEVSCFGSGEEFFASLDNGIPELLLLDIMLPGEDGISILKKIRDKDKTKKLPVIMLTAKDTEYDKIIGLDNGADDYVTKPFGMMELVSRIKAILRRIEKKTLGNLGLSYKDLVIDDEAHKVWVKNKETELTLKEYNTLKLLLKKKGKVVGREELLVTVWGYNFDGETRTIDVHIRSLRFKLKEAGDYIKTVRGVGYRIGET